jgi:hypothetical protein
MEPNQPIKRSRPRLVLPQMYPSALATIIINHPSLIEGTQTNNPFVVPKRSLANMCTPGRQDTASHDRKLQQNTNSTKTVK